MDTASLVGSDVVASALARAMLQQWGVSASDIEIVVTATSDGSGVGVAYAVQAESAASAAARPKLPRWTWRFFMQQCFRSWRRQVLQMWSVRMFPTSEHRLSYCPFMLMLKASPSVTDFFP